MVDLTFQTGADYHSTENYLFIRGKKTEGFLAMIQEAHDLGWRPIGGLSTDGFAATQLMYKPVEELE